MKTIPLIVSLAVGVAAAAAMEEDSAAAAAANGGIRATKVVTDRTKRDAAAAGVSATTDGDKKKERRRSAGDDEKEGRAKRRSSRKMKNRSGHKGRSSGRKDRSKQRTQRIQRDPEEHKKLNDRRKLIKERVDRSKRQQAEGDSGNDDGKKDAKKSLANNIADAKKKKMKKRHLNPDEYKTTDEKAAGDTMTTLHDNIEKMERRTLNKNDDAKTTVNTQAEKLFPKDTKEKGLENDNEEERTLMKAKSDKGGWGNSGGGGWHDSYSPDFRNDWHDSWDNDNFGGGGRFKIDNSHDDWGWGGGYGGKSDKGGDWGGGGGRFKVDSHDDWGWGGGGGWGGKSDKGGGGGSWGGGYGGKSGKGGWDSGGGYGGKSGKGGYYGGSCDDWATVTITNLSFRQSFSEIFAMTASKDVTWRRPVFVFGNRTNEALAELAQEADASEMLRRYDHCHGVEQTKIFDDFDQGPGNKDENFLEGGKYARFKIRTSGYGNFLTIAAGLPFTNDGAVVLEGEPIYDGAEYYIYPIDVGAEANLQTCWSVAAEQDDFPPLSQCSDEDFSDENENEIGGENFVHVHRGMQDIDDEKDLDDLLLWECDELDDIGLDKCLDNQCFAEYFWEVGYDDDFLLCQSGAFGADRCNWRDDQDFIDTANREDTDDNVLIKLAAGSNDFQDFCDYVNEINDDILDGFKTLEPWLFDWRNDMAKIKIRCGWHGDGWSGDSWDGDWGHFGGGGGGDWGHGGGWGGSGKSGKGGDWGGWSGDHHKKQ